jgi:hypothetical protein
MTLYAQPITYHTLITQFTQINLQKGERIKYFNSHFFKTLNQIPNGKHSMPVIFGCYNNAIPSNTNCEIRVEKINTLDEAFKRGKNGRIYA